MKKKLFSFICGIFMAVFSIFSMTGCTLVSVNQTMEGSTEIMRVGTTTLTKSDITSAYYTYYQNNSSYFAYYDDETIENSFYIWVAIREILYQKAYEMLYDADSNPTGVLYYIQSDEDEVWESLYSYIYSQVSAYEEAIYASAGYEEDDYPIWLQDEDDEEEETIFEAYSTSKPEREEERTAENVVSKSTDDEIIDKIDDIKAYLFEYVSETDDEGNETRANIDETDYIVGARNQAYANYISSLVSSAKANGTSTDITTVLQNEVIRIYEAYYQSLLTSLLQEYYLNVEIFESGVLSDEVIVQEFLSAYYTDYQNYQVDEDSYISVMTSTDGASLVYYHYNGRDYFFSVQHILLAFDDNQTALLGELTGSGSSNEEASAYYKELRDDLVEKLEKAGAILTEVNLSNGFDSIDLENYGAYYYYDESKANDETCYGYVKVSVHKETDDETGEETTIYYIDDDDTPGYSEGDTTYSADDVKFMATVDEVLNCYKNTYNDWSTLVSNYYTAYTLSSQDTTTMESLRTEHADMEYVFDTVENMATYNYSLNEIQYKVASYLFLELEWAYSGDSLGNEISNKIGYIISNYDGENGSWVTEFAEGSRELMAKYEDYIETYGSLESDSLDLDDFVINVTTDYGIHIIKIENIYEAGSSLIDLSSLIDADGKDPVTGNDVDTTDSGFVAAVIALMKQTYVSASSNETIYDYFFDDLYEGYASTSSSSTSYFLQLEYKWLGEYYESGNIEYINKLTYDELSDLLS